MIQDIFPRCVGYQRAVNCCILSTCDSPTLICQKENCQCAQNHLNCQFNIPLENISKKMTACGQKYLPALQKIHKCYQNMIQQLTLENQSVLKIMNEPALALEGDAGNFNKLLKSQKQNQISSKLALRALNCLSQQYKISSNQESDQVQRQIEAQKQKFIKIISKLKQNWVCQSKPLSSIIKIDQNKISQRVKIQGQTITCLSNSKNYQIVYFKPTIQTPQNRVRSFRFKIKQIGPEKSKFIIGVCHKNTIEGRECQIQGYKSTAFGSYIMRGNGQVICATQTNRNFKFQMDVQDVIKVTYDPISELLIYFNQNKGSSDSIKIKHEFGNEMYLMINLYTQGNAIQYLGQCRR